MIEAYRHAADGVNAHRHGVGHRKLSPSDGQPFDAVGTDVAGEPVPDAFQTEVVGRSPRAPPAEVAELAPHSCPQDDVLIVSHRATELVEPQVVERVLPDQ